MFDYSCVCECACTFPNMISYLARSCFDKVLGQLQGCQSILSWMMTQHIFCLYFPPEIRVEKLVIDHSGTEIFRDSTRTHFSMIPVRTLSLNLRPHSLLYSSDVSITCLWMSCRAGTDATWFTAHVNEKTEVFVLRYFL